jgi:hypothetical protein
VYIPEIAAQTSPPELPSRGVLYEGDHNDSTGH